jgi:hypothetical protein
MNRQDLGELKNLYENVIYEQPLASARERTQQQLELSRAKAAAGRAANAARMAAIAQRKAPENEVKGVAGPPTPGTTTAGEKPSVPTRVTPAKPGMSSPANATNAQKIAGGMKVYGAQRKAGDLKGAAETGKNISSLKFGSPEERKAKTIGTRNPLMDKTFGYQTGNSPQQQKSKADAIINSGKVAAIKPQPEVQAKSNLSGGSYSASATSMMSQRAKNILGTQQKPMKEQSQEWPSAKTIKDIADAYASIYEAKKKDQDQDGDTDFADVQIARMIASGMSRAEAIAAVKNKEYNEEYELDEATRMRKELGKEGETRVRGELAARSRAYKRSGSVDKTIAAAERGADRPYIKHKRNESDADRKKREEKQSKTLTGLASSRRGSVRDKPRVELRGYAAKVEGSDKDLQRARSSAMSAGTLTPKEKKQLGEEYQIYEIVASYLLENNFAETLNDANVIIENMSENWLEEILNNYN